MRTHHYSLGTLYALTKSVYDGTLPYMKAVNRYYTLRLKSLCLNWNMVISQNKGPQYRLQNTRILIIGTPKRVPLILGNPHIFQLPHPLEAAVLQLPVRNPRDSEASTKCSAPDQVHSLPTYMGGCQNYGPFLDPYYNTAPNI